MHRLTSSSVVLRRDKEPWSHVEDKVSISLYIDTKL